jgi:hypothetical protein
MSDKPEIECPECNGEGIVERPVMPESGIRSDTEYCRVECDACDGDGWREMTDDELSDAVEAQEQRRYEDFHDGGGQPSLDEQRRAAWAQKQELK